MEGGETVLKPYSSPARGTFMGEGIFNGNETISKRSARFGSRDFDSGLMLYYRKTRHSRGRKRKKRPTMEEEVEKPARFGP